jgi:hypothetical protein
MSKEASIVVWYGLSGRAGIGGLPESTYQYLVPQTKHLYHTTRQIAGDARALVHPLGGQLVVYGHEFGAERYGLGVMESVEYVSASEAAIALPGLFQIKWDWNSKILMSAKALNWPSGTMQWWAAAFLSES